MDLLPEFVALAFLLLLVWALARPRSAFVVEVVDGVPEVVRGKATPAFVGRIREICGEYGWQNGTVRGLVRGRRISLAFSRDIPVPGQQQLRNWWAVSGWSPARSRSRRP